MPSCSRFLPALAAALLPLFVGGCAGAALKYIDFSVYEGNKPVPVQKQYFDGLGIDGNASKSFAAAQQGDVPKAIQFMKLAIATYPTDPYDRYDLGVLHEAAGDWASAEVEMKEAVRLSGDELKGKPNHLFTEELAFVERHKPKR